MSNTERIHSDFETIERDSQNYRISTRVNYRPTRQEYRCKATLYKSYGGRVQYPEADRMYRSTAVVSEKDSIEVNLEECINSCKRKLDEIEDAKDVSVDVTITD